ncbi:asparaginase [Nonomuraea phyllanthi]|uniref:Asparaginase n=1 Tax=Nonomuraea phyllanthi TaxID=2219224 RepID=A0A5C4VK39_9ACTN|nr:asparaginase [Nonomuraea phyllanthi]KAB8189135.1 asparaginase [Nonomuraea phyllanthi]
MTGSDRRIRVVALGGTIAMAPRNELGGVAPALDADELVAAVPDVPKLGRIETDAFAQVPGAHLRLVDLVRLSRRIEEAFKDGVDGVVVTQGTDTIEESGMALDLLLNTDRPVVVTGAMRHPTQSGADGPANLRNAILVAASEKARGLGVLVTMNDEIHAARFVRKAHASRPSAFTSASAGALGWTAEDRVRIPLRPVGRVFVDLPDVEELAAVALASVALGDDGRLLRLLPDLGYQGVVVAGFGVGHVPARMIEDLTAVAYQVPVVLASRTGAGETFSDTYGFPGSERDLLARGVIPAGALAPPQARVLLSLALSAGWPAARIAEAFDVLSG